MKCQKITIKRRQLGSREFDSITVVIADLHLSTDLVDDRQIRQAKRLADGHQCWFVYDTHNAERVRAALRINAESFGTQFDEMCMRKELGED